MSGGPLTKFYIYIFERGDESMIIIKSERKYFKEKKL